MLLPYFYLGIRVYNERGNKKARPRPGIDFTKVKGGTFVKKSPEGLGLTTL